MGKRIMLLALLLAGSTPVPVLGVDTSPVIQVVCNEGTGSAVNIGNGKYVSVAHVMGLTSCKVKDEPVRNVVLDTKDGHDFATFDGPEGASASYSCKGFKAGKIYLAVGYAFGYETVTVEPLLATVFHDSKTMFVGEVIPGMSGGAVFDEDGVLVGVVNQRWPARSTSLEDTLCQTKTSTVH